MGGYISVVITAKILRCSISIFIAMLISLLVASPALRLPPNPVISNQAATVRGPSWTSDEPQQLRAGTYSTAGFSGRVVPTNPAISDNQDVQGGCPTWNVQSADERRQLRDPDAPTGFSGSGVLGTGTGNQDVQGGCPSWTMLSADECFVRPWPHVQIDSLLPLRICFPGNKRLLAWWPLNNEFPQRS